MKTRKGVQTIYCTRNTSSIRAITDFLGNSKTKMITIDFVKSDGTLRTINGMIKSGKGMAYNPFERGYIPVVENIIEKSLVTVQCKTVATQFRVVNLTTVSRIAFNKKVIEFV